MNDLIEQNAQVAQFRDLNTVKAEINGLWQTATQTSLMYAVQLGQKLTEAKGLVEHGEWGNWVKENLPFSQDKATMLMKIFDEYGANQISLFGDLNSDTYRNLGFYKAFALLSVPENEREDFVKENDVESMSVRELKAAIKERDEAKQAQEKAEKERDRLDADNRMLRESNKEMLSKVNSADELKRTAETIRMEKKDAEERLKIAEEETEKLKQEKQKLTLQLKDAQEAKAVPSAEDVEKAVTARLQKEQETQKAEAEKEIQKAIASKETEIENLKSEAEKLRKQLAMASEDFTVFKTYFDTMQTDMNKMLGAYLKLKQSDPEKAEKMKTPISCLSDKLREAL